MLWLDGQIGRGVDSAEEVIDLGDRVLAGLFGGPSGTA